MTELRHDTVAMTMRSRRSGNLSSKLRLMTMLSLTFVMMSSSSSWLSNAYALSSVTKPSSRISRNGKMSTSSTARMALSFNCKLGNCSNKGSHMLGVRGGGGTTSTTTTTSIRSSSSSSTTGDGGDIVSSSPSSIQQSLSKLRQFGSKNFFLLGMFLVVGCAKLFPMLGKDGGILRSELFVGKFGVSLIFLLSGLSLEISELTQAVTNFELNATIQLSTFLLWPFLIGVPLKNLLLNVFPQLFPKPLVDGLLILSCLPTTINMCIMLTSASGGNVATSICNAVISNLLGIFATPALLFYFFGTQISLPFIDMVLKLCNKVLLPVAIGQALRLTKAKEIYSKNSKQFKRLQEIILLGIVWNAFCNAFTSGLGLKLQHSIGLLVLLPTLHLLSLIGMFRMFSIPKFQLSRPNIIAAMFCSSQKTLAFGLPLVNTIFEGNPNLAFYCAPIMFIHPLQMIVGSILLPKIQKYTQGEAKS